MMDRTLGYLRESLSNHLEHHLDLSRTRLHLHNASPEAFYKSPGTHHAPSGSKATHANIRVSVKHYANEGEFVKDLNDLEMDALNQVLEKEIKYAENEQDEKRTMELNEVYELLF